MKTPHQGAWRNLIGTAIIAALLSVVASRARAGSWDGSESSSLGNLSAQIKNLPAPPAVKGVSLMMPSTGAGQAAAPDVVSDVSAFSVTQADINAVERRMPDPASELGRKIIAIMHRAYLGGQASQSVVSGPNLRVLTWNINAAKTKKAVDAILAVFRDSPQDLKSALGHSRPLKKKVLQELGDVSNTDVFLLQEVPLPTAIKIGQTVGAQVFWAPEFLEVGDNAKGQDPVAAQDYTGNAILSRVPLSDLRVLRFKNQADWYYGQKGPQPLGDRLNRLAASILFAVYSGNQRQTRPQAPYGGRLAMFARVPISGGRKVWVVNLHLEDLNGAQETGPQLRRAQMDEALSVVRTLPSPVLLGGDWNTMGGSVGVGEAQDMAAEAPNLMHPIQAPIDREHGLAAGTGNKFLGVIDAGNLVTTLVKNPGGYDTVVTRRPDGTLGTKKRSRKKLALEQAGLLAIDIAPYAPTAHDGIRTIQEIKADHKPINILLYGAEFAADFSPYTAAPAKGFQIWTEEKARHDPTSRFNADDKLFKDVEKEAGAKPLNPRNRGFYRFGAGGYKSTWSAGRPIMVPGVDRGLVDTVIDWLFLRDPQGTTLKAKRAQVYKDLVIGSKNGSAIRDRLSDHFPMRVVLPIVPADK